MRTGKATQFHYVHVNAIMDARLCSGCGLLYGYGPYPAETMETRVARPRYGEIKWCPRCEKPYPVLLRPMIWPGIPVVPFEYVDLMPALRMAYTMGIGEPTKAVQDTRPVEERLAALGLATK